MTDNSGRKLGFANIGLADGSLLVADSNGYFRVPRRRLPAQLRISYAGFQPVAMRVGSDTALLVQLQPVDELQEVVVASFVLRRRSCCGCILCTRFLRERRAPAAPPAAATRIYPNPTRAILHLQGVDGLQPVYLFDAGGRLLRQWIRPFAAKEGSIGLDGMPPGTYLLRYFAVPRGWTAEKIILVP